MLQGDVITDSYRFTPNNGSLKKMYVIMCPILRISLCYLCFTTLYYKKQALFYTNFVIVFVKFC